MEHQSKPYIIEENEKDYSILTSVIGLISGIAIAHKFTNRKWYYYLLLSILFSSVGSQFGKGINKVT